MADYEERPEPDEYASAYAPYVVRVPAGGIVGLLERQAVETRGLLAGLPAEAWTRRGVANGQEVSVRGVAWIIAGHELHHRALLAERYLGATTASTERH